MRNLVILALDSYSIGNIDDSRNDFKGQPL